METDTNEISAKIKRKLDILYKALKSPRIWPVKRKAYKTISGRLEELRQSISSPSGPNLKVFETQILDILDTIEESLPESAAWDVADSLKLVLPKIAPDHYLYSALVEEKAREGKEFLWEVYFDAPSLEHHITTYETEIANFNRELVADRLIALYRLRNDKGRHDRARDGERTRYLRFMGILLFCAVPIVIGLWYLNARYTEPWLHLLIVAVSGSIGAILSGAMKLKDLNRIVELKTAGETLFSQSVFGGILAVIVFLILQSKIITISGFDTESANTAIIFVIGLLSGFSEPFALGILEKIASLGK